MDEETVRRLIREELRMLGVYYQDEQHLERTRLNFRTLEEITAAREAARGAFKRGVIEAFTKGAATLLWIPVMALVTYLAPVLWKAILKALQ